MHRRHAGELGGDLDQGFGDEDGDGVEIGAVGAQAQALGFQGDGAAATEGVQDGRSVLKQLIPLPRRPNTSSREPSPDFTLPIQLQTFRTDDQRRVSPSDVNYRQRLYRLP